jgi:hypothetical protein
MLTIPAAVKLWYSPDAVDMRLGFDGLFALVKNRLLADPLCGHLFIFRNRCADHLKVLYWGRDGLCLWYNEVPPVGVDSASGCLGGPASLRAAAPDSACTQAL